MLQEKNKKIWRYNCYCFIIYVE